MDTEIDWRAELDASIGRAPDVPASHYAQVGRRAVRRRRAGLAGLASAAVVGAIAWAATPGAPPLTADTLTAAGPGSATPNSSPTASVTAIPWRKDDPPARAVKGQGLEIREGSVVHARLDDIYPSTEGHSVALDLSYAGERLWMVLQWDESGATSTVEGPAETPGSFESFVADAVGRGGKLTMLSTIRKPLARLTTEGLELRPGVIVVKRVENPLGLASPRSSVGLVLRGEDGISWALLDASPTGGGGEVELQSDAGEPTFDQWLANAVALQHRTPGSEKATPEGGSDHP